MSTCDLSALVALEPPGAGRIHLHLPGYRPGKKQRTQANAPLCGVFVYSDLNQVALDVARLWTHVRPTWAGSEMAGERYWCPPCLGRLVELLSLQDHIVAQAEIRQRTNPGLTPHVDMGNVIGAGGDQPTTGMVSGQTPPAPAT